MPRKIAPMRSTLDRFPETLGLRLQNLGAAAAVVALACSVYRLSPFNHQQLNALYGPAPIAFKGDHFLLTVAVGYVLLLALFYFVEHEPGVSKSQRFFRLLIRFAAAPVTTLRSPFPHEDRVAVLTTLLKSFFGPMMVVSLMDFCMGALVNGLAIAATGALSSDLFALFNRHGYWFVMQTILFVDVLVFTLGYLVEMPRLGNEIRSVDPTLLGWTAALVCYPPFNQVTAAVLGSYRSEFPRFDEPTVHLLMNLLLLLLMAVYAAASVALGLKASNLTHRGIVCRGPYALLRHPAYLCKNLAWWIGAAPFIAAAFAESAFSGLQALGSMAGWSLIYVMRALTEEDHLRGVDGDYAAYAQKVRWRFIPGVY